MTPGLAPRTTFAAPRSVPAPAAPDLSRREYARVVRRLALLVVGLGAVARLFRYAIDFPVWGDEAFIALNVAGRDYAGLTRQLDYAQVCPVLFLWAVRAAFELFGDSEYALRLVPTAASVLALWFFWDFARRVTTPTVAAVAAAALAVSRWPVCLGPTLKPYATDLFWATALLALAARWRTRPGRLWPLVALTVAAPVAMFASYPAAFVGGGVALYLAPAVWRQMRPGRAVLFVLFNLLMVGGFAAHYLLIGREQLDPRGGSVGTFMHDYWRHGFPPEDPLGWPLWFLRMNAGRLFAYPIGDANGGSALTLLLALLGGRYLWRPGSRGLVVLCVAPFALNLLAAGLHKYPYGGCARLSQHLAPAVCLLAAAGTVSLLDRVAPTFRARLKWVGGLFAVYAAFAVGGIVYDAAVPSRDGVSVWCRGAARELKANLAPGDVIVLAPGPWVDVDAEWYLSRLGCPVVPVDRFDPATAKGRVWVFTFAFFHPDPGREKRTIEAVRGDRVPTAAVCYALPPERDTKMWLYWGVVCLGKPDDLPPKLACRP